jgi:hypothetical protein
MGDMEPEVVARALGTHWSGVGNPAALTDAVRKRHALERRDDGRGPTPSATPAPASARARAGHPAPKKGNTMPEETKTQKEKIALLVQLLDNSHRIALSCIERGMAGDFIPPSERKVNLIEYWRAVGERDAYSKAILKLLEMD